MACEEVRRILGARARKIDLNVNAEVDGANLALSSRSARGRKKRQAAIRASSPENLGTTFSADLLYRPNQLSSCHHVPFHTSPGGTNRDASVR